MSESHDSLSVIRKRNLGIETQNGDRSYESCDKTGDSSRLFSSSGDEVEASILDDISLPSDSIENNNYVEVKEQKGHGTDVVNQEDHCHEKAVGSTEDIKHFSEKNPKKKRIRKVPKRLVTAGIIATFAVALAFFYQFAYKVPQNNYDHKTNTKQQEDKTIRFTNYMNNIMKKFPTQTVNTWHSISDPIKRTLSNMRKPLVIVFMYHQQSHLTVHCLTELVASATTEMSGHKIRSHQTLNVTQLQQDNKFNQEVYIELNRKLESYLADDRTVVIQHLQNLDTHSINLFQDVLEEGNIQSKEVKLLLTFQLTSLSPMSTSLPMTSSTELKTILLDEINGKWAGLGDGSSYLQNFLTQNVVYIYPENQLGHCSLV